MAQDIRSFFHQSTSSSSRSSIRKYLEPKTPEKQANGTVSKKQLDRVSVSKMEISNGSPANGNGAINGNGHDRQIRKGKRGLIILSSDESDAEDPLPSCIAKTKEADKSRRKSPSRPVPVPCPPKRARKGKEEGKAGIEKEKMVKGKKEEFSLMKKKQSSSNLRPRLPSGEAAGKSRNNLPKQPLDNKRKSSGEEVELPKTTYFGVEKQTKGIRIGGKLLTNLDQAHDEIRTPAVHTTPRKKQDVLGGGGRNDQVHHRSPSYSTRSASKSCAILQSVEKTPNKETSSVHRTPSKELDYQTMVVSVCTRTPKKTVTPAKSSSTEKSAKKSLTRKSHSPTKKVTPLAAVSSKLDAWDTLAWVDKYKPTSMKQIIGQQGEKSCMNKLFKWLQDWPKSRVTGEKKKRFSKGASDDGSSFKAVLLSGPPGIGKTTTAQLACKELGKNVVELNASDARNKRSLEQRIAECLGSHSMDEYYHRGKGLAKQPARSVLIMDEVDGMSGTEDRAGIAELIALIKTTHFPIICICNDRHSQKIRSLANHCYDLRFHRPQVGQIRGSIMSILFKEKAKLPAPVVDEIIECAGHDVRQVLNHLNFLTTSGKLATVDDAKRAAKSAGKDETLNVFESVRKLFSASDSNQQMTLTDKAELFFSDYDLVPLFVEENYLHVEPAKAKNKVEQLDQISRAAELMSWGDTVDRQIRNEQNWSLLNQKAMLSTVLPCELMKGRMHGQITFPTWFGRFSKQNKLQRQMQQLQFHSSGTASASVSGWVLDYAPALRQCTIQPLLKEDGAIAGVNTVLRTLNAYALTLDDRNAVLEITQYPDTADPMANVTGRVKAALTRAYKKHERKLPYPVDEVPSGKKRRGSVSSDVEAEDIDHCDG